MPVRIELKWLMRSKIDYLPVRMVFLRELEVRLPNLCLFRLGGGVGDAENGERVLGRHARGLLLHLGLPRLGPNSIEKFWREFWFEKLL